MKKEMLSPIFTFLAMVLIIISRVIDTDKTGDIIGYLAIIVAVLALVQVYKIYRKFK